MNRSCCLAHHKRDLTLLPRSWASFKGSMGLTDEEMAGALRNTAFYATLKAARASGTLSDLVSGRESPADVLSQSSLLPPMQTSRRTCSLSRARAFRP